MAIRLDELRVRLTTAEGPDRDIDQDIVRVFMAMDVNEDGSYKETASLPFPAQRPYTASLDAAIALVEAKLPGARRQMQMDYEGSFCYWLTSPGSMMSSAIHASEPIALLLALLSALEKESAE